MTFLDPEECDDEFMKLLAMTMHRDSAKNKDCIVCDIPTHGRAAYMPENPLAWGGKTGRRRVFIFAVCDEHRAQADVVEQALIRQVFNTDS